MLKKRWTKVLVFSAGLAPIFWLCWRAWNQNLTANPIEFITHYTGDWTIRFIVFTLAVTPLRKVLGLPDLIRFRRMTGLYAFFYGTLHLLIYIVADRFAGLVDFPGGMASLETAHRLIVSIGSDIYKRPFITVGFTAWLCMLSLALTSTAGMIRRLGDQRGTAGGGRHRCPAHRDGRPRAPRRVATQAQASARRSRRTARPRARTVHAHSTARPAHGASGKKPWAGV